MEFYRSFYNFSPMPMGVVLACQDDMLNIDCNYAAAAYFGLPVTEVRGRTSSSMGAPLDCIKEWLKVYELSLAASAPQNFTYISPCATDQERYLCCTIYPISHGHFAYIINDVTHIKKAELRAVQLQTKNQMLVNTLDAVVWEVDAETGGFNFVSDRTEECLGIAREEWNNYDQFFDKIISPLDRPYLPTLSKIPEGEHMDMTVRINTRAYKPLSFPLARISLCKSDDAFGGKMIVGMIRGLSIGREISKQDEKNVELMQKRSIAGQISGEMRGPMNQLLGVLELMRESHLSEQQRLELLTNASMCSLSLQSSLDELLEMPEKDHKQCNNGNDSVINLRNILETETDTLAPKAEQKRIDLIPGYPSTYPAKFFGKSQPAYVRLTITKLLELAIRCTTRGNVSVGIEIDDGMYNPTVVVALPYVDHIYNDLLTTLDNPLNSLLQGESKSSSLLMCRVTLQAIGGQLKLSHSESAIFLSCTFKMKASPVTEKQFDISDVKVWTTLSQNSTLNAPIMANLTNWNASVTHMSPEDVLERLSDTSDPPDLILIDDEDFYRIASAQTDKPVVVVSRYANFKTRYLQDLKIINLFRPVSATKLQSVIEKCLKKDEETINITGSPDSSPLTMGNDFGLDRPHSKRKMGELSLVVTRNVLVLDTSDVGQRTLSVYLKQMDFVPSFAGSVKSAVETLEAKDDFDLIIVDISREYEEDPVVELKKWVEKNGTRTPAIFALSAAEEDAPKGYDSVLQKPASGMSIRQAFEEFESGAQHKPKMINRIKAT